MKRFLYIIMLLGVSLGLQAQVLHWDTAGVNIGGKATIMLGDQLNVVVSSDNQQFPSSNDLSQNDILILSQHLDSVSHSMVYVATCFEEGEHMLGVGEDSIVLIVNDVPDVDTTKAEIKDIARIMREPYTFWEIFRWFLLAFGVAALVWLIMFIVKKIKRKEPIITLPKPAPLPPHVAALNELELLRKKELWQVGRIKEYHTELTDILRHYLQERFAIDSFEMTSGQTLDAYEESCHGRNESYELLRQVLRSADMVKFAKAEPQGYEHDLSMKNAKAFVESTTPEPQEKKD